MAAQVDAREAEAARHRDVLGGELDEERPALVRARGLALDDREQLVGDDRAGDLPRVERARGGLRQQVDVREHRDRQPVVPQPAQELVVLARVPADLVDREAGAGLDLLPQLEVLRHHLALAPLVVRDDGAEEEVRLVEPRVRPALVAQALVHLREEANRVNPAAGPQTCGSLQAVCN